MLTKSEISTEEVAGFTQEWAVLHADHEKYERYSLLIKLANVFICLFLIVYEINLFLAIIFIGLIWLQDGIWKTFQARISDRILLIERCIKEQISGSSNEVSFQFYSDWEKSPKGSKNLIQEYLENSFRPTVAYPHVVLVFIQVIVFLV